MLQHQHFLNNVFGNREEQEKMALKAEDVIKLLWSGFGKSSVKTLGHTEKIQAFTTWFRCQQTNKKKKRLVLLNVTMF